MTNIWYALFSLTILTASPAFSQKGLRFFENRGQFNCPEKFKCEVGSSQIYFGSHYLIYNLFDLHETDEHTSHEHRIEALKGHCVRIEFANSNTSAVLEPFSERPEKYNYYLGNNPAKWATQVPLYNGLAYKALYPNIDVNYYSRDNHLKYDIVLNPGANERDVCIRYLGQDALKLVDGKLCIYTSVGNIVEESPYAYQLDEQGNKKQVACRYSLKGNKLSFVFPDGYDRSRTLVIDPTVVFSTYSSTSALLSADGATYDSQGNLYIACGTLTTPAYQSTPGAFTSIAQATTWNIVIEKYASGGGTQLYGALIGGNPFPNSFNSGNDYPYSLFCDSNDNLFVLGTSNSPDYPTTSGCYDNSLASTAFTSLHPNDYVISKISSNGASLLASTFLGGPGNEGGAFQQNVSTIYTDAANNVFVVGLTDSTGYPTTPGVLQPFRSGSSDGVMTKLTNNLTSVVWSTYLGGTGTDNICDVKVAPNGNLYLCGVTTSTNFPGVAGSLNPTNFGGQDGFVSVVNASGTSLIRSTYLGTSAKDKAKFVQSDASNNVYVLGATKNPTYPTSSGAFNQPGAYNYFIHKLNSGLTGSVFSCCLGGNSNSASNINEFVPTAFGVDSCNQLYFSGSCLNGGLPLTSNAISSNAKSIYLAALDNNGSSLLFGSYYGGNVPASNAVGSHIHESTNNRFDKKGILYHTECYLDAAYSLVNQISADANGSFNNAASFKLDMGVIPNPYVATIDPASIVSPTCGMSNGSASVTVNGGSGNFTYTWSPGGGSSNTLSNAAAGPYTVTIKDQFPVCGSGLQNATVTLTTTTTLPLTTTSATVCAGSPATITVSGATSYTWSPSTGLSATTGSAVVVSTGSAGATYTVSGATAACTGTATASVSITQPTLSVNSSSVCAGETLTLTATGASGYTWTPSTGLNSATGPTVVASPSASTQYTVTGSVGSCTVSAVSQVSLVPKPTLILNAPTLCAGQSTILTAAGASSYSWSPAGTLSATTGASVTATPLSTSVYTVVGSSGACANTATTVVTVNPSPTLAVTSVTICNGGTATLTAAGATSYTWSSGVSSPSMQVTTASTSVYTVAGTGSNGCISSKQATITVVGPPQVSSTTIANVRCNGGSSGSISIQATGSNTFSWTPNVAGSASATNLGPGIYTCTLSSIPGCSTALSFTITEPPPLTATVTQSNTTCNYCNGSATVTATGGVNPYTYQWASATPTGSVHAGLCAGNYTVNVKDSNLCNNTYTLNIAPSAGITATASASDYEVRAGDQTQLTCTHGASYTWSPDTSVSCQNCQNPIARPFEDTRYCVTVTDSAGCKDTACVDIKIECGNVYIPTAFSPNDDGINDVFCVYGNCIASMELRVFDRWGNLVFEGYDKQTCWNGKYHGIKANTGVFIYDLQATMKDGQKISKHGNVTLVN